VSAHSIRAEIAGDFFGTALSRGCTLTANPDDRFIELILPPFAKRMGEGRFQVADIPDLA
jgi:hypothetical protein